MDNVRDMLSKGRLSTKITAQQVAEIRSAVADGGVTHKQLAAKYGIDRSMVGFIANMKTRVFI